ncbi:microfibrillar-associated protein 1-like [Leptinotarsa decemlineata]|uniref:microfibrillar-associated protein 1-like n=1 Tax=Leptinotarsa decemlineata TaxID=7539 RepID=UPI003D30770E
MMNPQSNYSIQSTAGAVPVRNEKGESSMQKVKVHRYVSGKKPDYAHDDSESEEDDFVERIKHVSGPSPEPPKSDEDQEDFNDPRLRRLKIAEVDTEVRPERRRHIVEGEVLDSSEDEEEGDKIHLPENKHTLEAAPDDDESEAELSDSEIEKKREMMKQRMLNKQEEEFMAKEEEKDESDSEDSSEYEEYTDSEEETGPRLKPVFIRKKDRITTIEKEHELEKKREEESQRKAEERRKETLRLVEETIRKEQQFRNKETNEPNLNDVCTDDENDEVVYEAWKLRELKRVKRDREEKEEREREKMEIEKLRTMSEEERRIQLRLMPKTVTNKAAKGKYKYLQKYYHRGAFYLDKEDEVYKRDFAQATLEDHFDKTILPKVMQVKNFGRSGRTKYTHLVDQDTTQFDSPWSTENAQNQKFHSQQAGGVKPVFEKPSWKKRKMQ